MKHKVFPMVVGNGVPMQPGATLDYQLSPTLERELEQGAWRVVSHTAEAAHGGLFVTLYCVSERDD